MSILQFDFHGETKVFEHPEQIIQANTIEEVIPALTQVQDAIQSGYYAAGYLSYESAPAFENAMQVHTDNKMPLLWFGIYSDVKGNLINHENRSYHTTDWNLDTSTQDYNRSIKTIKDHIEQGDTYQVNYTIRMHANFSGYPFSYYKQLSNSQAASYSAYLDIGTHQILSASPELFFHLKDGKVTTKPMKGTIARGKSEREDQENSNWLYHSEKNRAENVMIVDLLRNDLGMISKPGTVQVPELFTIEEYPTVYQMTSTVTGEIAKDKTIVDIFKALFPCGSITGAPKINTMKLINQLEGSPREVYCGAIGYITPEKEAIFNVPIRTVILDEAGHATYGVGGGITWDSEASDEYQEVFAKAKILTKRIQDFQLLETIKMNNGELFLLEQHVKRLVNSAECFGFTIDIVELEKELSKLKDLYNEGYWKVRVLLNRNGNTSLEVLPFPPLPQGIQKVSLAKLPINKNNIFHYHKTTNRTFYDLRLKEVGNVFDCLLWNEQGEITEFTRGNIVVEMEGERFTPPVSSGLLAGTFREVLLQEGHIQERILMKDDLSKCNRIWFINSVREWIEVEII